MALFGSCGTADCPKSAQGSRIPDPNPKMSVDEVRELLTPACPEIATATLTGLREELEKERAY